MNSKEIKSSLKDAREFIKNKEFSSALKLSKSILKSDKENYMALVFLGISLQEVGPYDQAPHAFRKAILINSDQVLAWNGLANYYEKDDSDNASKELIPIYEKLLQMECEAIKFSELCSKLVLRATEIGEISKAANILKSLTTLENINENNRRTVWLALASLLAPHYDSTPELMDLYELTLSSIVKERSSVTSDYYKEYLRLLYKMKKYTLVFTEAINMHSLYETSVYPLEWICKIYVELVIENDSLADQFEDQISLYISEIFKLQSDALMGTFAQAVRLFREKNYIESKVELKKVINVRAGFTHAWALLAECNVYLLCYNEATQAATRADKLLQTLTKENINLRRKVDRMLVISLARNSSADKWTDAVTLGHKLLEKNSDDIEILKSIITAYINLENYEKAETYLEKINNAQSLKDYIFLKASLLHKQNRIEEALELLRTTEEESYEIFMKLGCLYWNLEKHESSLMPFLKAAKLNPNCYQCFIYLARYYEYCNDMEKARRCYQKAFQLNPGCEVAGIGLSNIYRQQKNWPANLQLLQTVTGSSDVTSATISVEVRWAWLQLGLHYLAQGDLDSAINSLRTVIRVEPDNGHYWECLADAYLARNAYTCALKSYERAVELTDDILYPQLQVATIKMMLGFYVEAKASFERLLKENEQYVPALKGLGENYLKHAAQNRDAQLLGACQINAQFALNQLTIALKQRSDLVCLWKLVGDCCVLIAGLPEKYSHLNVHCSLAEGRDADETITLYNLQLYTLAARCYCKMIGLTNQSDTKAWFNLARCYYLHSCALSKTSKEHSQLLQLAYDSIRFTITHNAQNSNNWNLLGVIAAHETLEEYALAQHAFIKATILDHRNAIAWNNLGTLYLLLGHVELANKAYSQGQHNDPSIANSWIGQAMIAETVSHKDAMDLFRHSIQLNYHNQGALGYADWVCRTILESPSDKKLYCIDNMHAVPVAINALTWYTENNPNNPCAWNMLGILKERFGFTNSTLNAFQTALKYIDPINSSTKADQVSINCGRMLTKLQRYDEAIESFNNVKAATFNEKCSLALALFKAGQYEQSYETYDMTINWLADSEGLQSHILVALAAMAYLFKGVDGAKTLLFQSTELKPASEWGLFAILALGLLHDDLSMAHLVLKELQPIRDQPHIIYHYAILHAITQLRQGDKKAAIRSMANWVHRHPEQTDLWNFLSVLLLKFDAEKMAPVASKFAQFTFKMGKTQMDITKTLCTVSLAAYLSQDIPSALTAAQRALHCHPHIAENWTVLITVLSYVKNGPKWPQQSNWVHNACNHVVTHLNPSEELNKWFEQFHH